MWERLSQWALRGLLTLLWHVQDNERRGSPGASPSISRPPFCPCNSVDHRGNSSGACRWSITNQKSLLTHWARANFATMPPKVLLSVCGPTCHDRPQHVHWKGYKKAVTIWHKTPTLAWLAKNSLAKAVYSSHEMMKSSDSYIFLQDNWRNSMIIGINIQLMLPNIF